MVGNDIVDLQEARQSRWEDPRFLDKLFTVEEQQYIKTATDSFTAIWHLWSMKEAAYKLHVQQYPRRFYAPKAFVCHCESSPHRVHYGAFVYYTTTKITAHYILSEARCQTAKMSSVCLPLVCTAHEFQSQKTRRQLLDEVAKTYGFTSTGLTLKTTELGVPKLYYNAKPLDIGVSLTHHGRYGAYAIS